MKKEKRIAPEQRQEWMSAYLDGMLNAEDAATFEAYVAQNEEAQVELGALRDIVGYLGTLPNPAPPADLFARVKAELDHDAAQAPAPDLSKPVFSITPWLGRAAAIAAVLLIMRVGYHEWQTERAPKSLQDVAASHVANDE
ncbi:MAG: hypothetical protein O3C57_02535, partial [Verrucomicrobia bacterium]|nr:hypothetical protein [Verrucomicrobiota bacterium]